MFVTIADFSAGGKYEIHTGIYETERLQSYIDKYEKMYLINLLGVDLYNDFIANPTFPEYVFIYEPFEVDSNSVSLYFGNRIIISEGMKVMLLGFIYFEYVKDLTNQITPVGNVRPVGENSADVSTLYSMMYARYNESIKTYRGIQQYICLNKGDYDTFNGVFKESAYWI
jgi:hypothetical protein